MVFTGSPCDSPGGRRPPGDLCWSPGSRVLSRWRLTGCLRNGDHDECKRRQPEPCGSGIYLEDANSWRCALYRRERTTSEEVEHHVKMRQSLPHHNALKPFSFLAKKNRDPNAQVWREPSSRPRSKTVAVPPLQRLPLPSTHWYGRLRGRPSDGCAASCSFQLAGFNNPFP